ncbi:hypothetical protein [Paenibacillus sp. FSL R7-0337]|uniref:hypothetical protein n=1 Tax=Paenibacillus sp. FSL R7-0337 TaxID=1926588 RepID=UPI00096C8A14|nr:hypothetical protein [Paenibacillus sp. FSL R7-0337]OMF88756.1 hypothetical protein BK147_26490 [Paenibacillus sp. FSL R7-0337]
MLFSAFINLILLPVTVLGFRLALIGFDEDVSMFERKLAGYAELALAALLACLMVVTGME